MKPTFLQRRGIAAITAGILLAILALSGSVAAVAEDSEVTPEAMILTLSNQVLDVIRRDAAIRAGDFGRVQQLVNERILPNVDFDRMTRLAVGKAWRAATAEQRAALIEQFRILLLRTYSGALSKVSDETVRLRPARSEDDPSDVIVRTQIVASQSDPIELDYRITRSPAGWKIYDINIIGVWLVQNYKNEFAAYLDQGGIDGLISALTQKNQKLAAAAKS